MKSQVNLGTKTAFKMGCWPRLVGEGFGSWLGQRHEGGKPWF